MYLRVRECRQHIARQKHVCMFVHPLDSNYASTTSRSAPTPAPVPTVHVRRLHPKAACIEDGCDHAHAGDTYVQRRDILPSPNTPHARYECTTWTCRGWWAAMPTTVPTAFSWRYLLLTEDSASHAPLQHCCSAAHTFSNSRWSLLPSLTCVCVCSKVAAPTYASTSRKHEALGRGWGCTTHDMRGAPPRKCLHSEGVTTQLEIPPHGYFC